jgi:hypothetical protein
VQTSVMEGAMSQTTATNIPQDAVEGLMKQAADEVTHLFIKSNNNNRLNN